MTFERFTTIARETATTAMRWFRPFTFLFLTFFFASAYWAPDRAEKWLAVVATTPSWLVYIMTAMIVGVAAEKGIRSLGEALSVIKGKSD